MGDQADESIATGILLLLTTVHSVAQIWNDIVSIIFF
jgi:hypothetical protein